MEATVTWTAMSALVQFGWNDEVARLVAEAGIDDAAPGRVVRVDRGRATVVAAEGSDFAGLGGHAVATGDWVLVRGGEIVAVLPRHSAFVRGATIEGVAREEQVVAANIDIVLVVQSLTNGVNARRLERELVLAYDSGATPVVVLSKADTHPDPEAAAAEIADVTTGVDVILTSSRTGAGVDTLRALASANRTIAFIGASGVGKSTLVNAIVGSDVQATGEVRDSDDRGRHTTTARELVPLPGGGVLLDTPGLRSLALWEAEGGLELAFADIESLAAQCRFSDCAHDREPGCAVHAAIARGDLDPARLENYRRLDAELDHAERRRQERILSRVIRKLPKRPG
jgi:ribosome small subunit-dependent GTPase A